VTARAVDCVASSREDPRSREGRERPPHKEMSPPLAGPRPSPWAHAAGSHLTREQAPRGRALLPEASADGRVEEDEEEEELAKESRRV